ncbi:hypothetical protein Za10_1352 [Zymomonas mobilis subsp. mobilis NCIMB 11163]|nr:hypothetical protein Za10_1352 [Zymomonas mobilis subsp. mobilis NCIMB 11163]
MRMTTIHAQAERKRQDRSVCRAEKRLCRARMLRVRGLIHPTSAVCATTDTARGEKRLPSEQNQAILKSSGRPLGECRFGLLGYKCFRTADIRTAPKTVAFGKGVDATSNHMDEITIFGFLPTKVRNAT